MSTSVSWPLIGGTSYSVPASGELNWAALSSFLIALGQKAQSVNNTKLAIRTATTSPVSVLSTTDTVVITALTVPGAVAVSLPAGATGQAFFIVDGTGDASTNNITITPNGGQLINGGATYVLNKDRAGVLIGFGGTSWTVLSEFTNVAAGTIPRSSIATGSANHVVINSGTGALSSEAQLAKSRGGTGADNSSVTFPASGIVVTESATETLTNKTIDDDNNVVQNVAVTALKTVIGQASTFLSFDGSGAPIATKAVPTGAVVGISDTQALTNKDYQGGTASNSSRLTAPSNTTVNLTALTRKAGTLVWDTTSTVLKYDDGTNLQTVAATGVATPTAQGTTTSYFATVQSSTNAVASANYTILTTDGYRAINVTTGALDRTITLPAASANTGRIVTLKKVDSGVGRILATRAGSDTMEGATQIIIGGQYGYLSLISDGTTWLILGLVDQGTFTATLTAVTGTVTATAFYKRIANQVHVFVPSLTGTSNSTTQPTITGAASQIFPSTTRFGYGIGIRDNTVTTVGVFSVNTSGVIAGFFASGGSTFTNTGAKGFDNGNTFSYILD